jgi:hypothetical protein
VLERGERERRLTLNLQLCVNGLSKRISNAFEGNRTNGNLLIRLDRLFWLTLQLILKEEGCVRECGLVDSVSSLTCSKNVGLVPYMKTKRRIKGLEEREREREREEYVHLQSVSKETILRSNLWSL